MEGSDNIPTFIPTPTMFFGFAGFIAMEISTGFASSSLVI